MTLFRKLVLILLLLAAALTVGCAAGQPPSATPLNPLSEKETAAEQSPPVLPAGESDDVDETPEQPPLLPQQSGSAPAEQPPREQEKPLVIVSENFVLSDSGQLLQALDKEMETLLNLLEKMDDIQNEDFNF